MVRRCQMRTVRITPVESVRPPAAHGACGRTWSRAPLLLRSLARSHPHAHLALPSFRLPSQGKTPRPPSPLPPLASGHCPTAPKTLARPGFTQTPAFYPNDLNICGIIIHRQIVKKRLYLGENILYFFKITFIRVTLVDICFKCTVR